MRFQDYVDPIHSHDTRWFLTLSGCHAGDFRASGVFGRHLERIYLWKTWFFGPKSTDSPMGSRAWLRLNLEGNQWFSAVRGSSAGNRWSNSTETIQKLHFWACKSSLEHPGGSKSWNRPEFLIVHILYKSFKPNKILFKTADDLSRTFGLSQYSL